MTESDKIEFLAGRIHALIGFATAAITSHPNPEVLAKHLEKILEVNSAKAETSPVSEEYIDGVYDVRDRLLASAKMVLEQKKSQQEPRG